MKRKIQRVCDYIKSLTVLEKITLSVFFPFSLIVFLIGVIVTIIFNIIMNLVFAISITIEHMGNIWSEFRKNEQNE